MLAWAMAGCSTPADSRGGSTGQEHVTDWLKDARHVEYRTACSVVASQRLAEP